MVRSPRITGPIPDETLTVKVGEDEVLLDLKALLSNYTCIYGQGCQGTTHPQEGQPGISVPQDRSVTGCCRASAQFGPGKGDDPERIAPYVDMLEEQDCENVGLVHQKGWFNRKRSATYNAALKTVGGSCIFLNSSEHAKPGCSLWHLAERIGERPQDLRPSICHTEPLMCVYVGDVPGGGTRDLITLRPYWKGWFDPEGWYCTKDPSAYRASTPVYQRMDEQLLWILGPESHRAVVEALDVAWKESGPRMQEQSWSRTVDLPAPQWHRDARQRKAQSNATEMGE